MGSPFPGMDPYLLLGAARPAAHPQRSSLVPEKGKGRGEPGIPMSPSIIVALAEFVSRSSVAHGLAIEIRPFRMGSHCQNPRRV